MARRVEEAIRLLETLIENREVYFDKTGYLNSEGMKILIHIARIVAEELPEHMKMVRKARSRRNYESILKLLRNLSNNHSIAFPS